MSNEVKNSRMASLLPWFCMAVIVATVGVLALLPGPGQVPQEMVGLWKTSEPAYADKSIEIGYAMITFGMGDGQIVTGFVSKVEVVSENGRKFYKIHYFEGGEELSCSLVYDPADGGVLRFKNQQDIRWIREEKQ